jgi:YihY family inner membrane protein
MPRLAAGSEVGAMRQLDRTLEGIDSFQRQSKPAGFLYGVVKKFGNDNGGMLAALMAYYGFLSLFPLMLLLITIVGLATGGSVSATQRVEHSALSQFPVIGAHLGENIHALHNRAGLGLAIGIIGLIWGSQGVIQAAQYTMAQVWNVPLVERPGYVARLLRALAVMAAVGLFLLVSTALAGVVTVGNRGGLAVAGAVVASLVLNVAIFAVAFRLLTPSAIPSRWLLPGAVFGAVGWTILQYVGGTLVDHSLRNTSQVYGFFAIVLGLLVWIYLGTQLTVYAAEVNVVVHRHLWPRSLRPPLTDADREVLKHMVLEQRSRHDQHVSVHFGTDAAEPETNGGGQTKDDEPADGQPTDGQPTNGQPTDEQPAFEDKGGTDGREPVKSPPRR